jgi:ubiquinone/menaquinone biosynthesis C-methylase UbiE
MTMAREDLARFYDESYRRASAEGDRHARWRQLSARGKADHAIALCQRAGLEPQRIVEIGCGDGALLAELGARGLAGELHGFEVSEEAARVARARGTPGLAGVSVYDGRRLPVGDREFDVAILSHVLEHVPDPEALLREAARVARAVVIEVPLEANLSASRAVKREGAAEIGHIQALDRRAVRDLVQGAGMRVREEVLDPLPLEVHTFFAPFGKPRLRATAKAALRRALFAVSPRLAERTFTLHYACLATP